MALQVLLPLAVQYGPALLRGVSRFGESYVNNQISSQTAQVRVEHEATQAALAFRRQFLLAGVSAIGGAAIGLGQSAVQDRRQELRQQRLADVAREFEQEQLRLQLDRDRELAEAERRYQAQRADDEHARQITARRIAERDARYPFDHGPGHLRDSFNAAYPAGGRRPLLVIIAPPSRESRPDAPWVDLDQRLKSELMRHQGADPGAMVRLAQRPMQWPDADLYAGDLRGLPTMILELSAGNKRLDLRLGGCHLIPDALSPVHEMRHLCALFFQDSADWSDEEISLLNAGSGPVGMGRLPSARDPDGLRELNHELAARLIALSIMAAVDCHQLMHAPAYDEQLDRVAQAAGTAGETWPIDYGLPLDAIRDPAYHLLHRVARRLRMAATKAERDDDAASAEIVRSADADMLLAVSMLAGHDSPRPDIPFADLLTQIVDGRIASYSHIARLNSLLRDLPAESAYHGTHVLALESPPDTVRRASPAIAGVDRGYDPDLNPFHP